MKFKRVILSILMIFSMLCMVACKDKEENTPSPAETKQDPVITVSYNKGISYYAGDKLETVELVLVGEGTAGTVAWENPETTLELGTKSYKWFFVPSDADKFNSKTGTLEVTAKTPLIKPVVSGVKIKDGQDIYFDSVLSRVELDSNFASNIEGTVVWSNPNKKLSEGENICAWVFIPTESDVYSRVTGTITVIPTKSQYLTSISVKSNTKEFGYVAYDKFDCSGLTLNLNYNAGKVETTKVTNANCAVTYNSGDSLKQGDTTVTIEYQSLTCEVVIDKVGYKIIEKPEFTDVVVYDGYAHTLKVEESIDGYYTIGDAFGIDADDYELKLTLTDSENLKWSDSETSETTVICTIQKADHEISQNGENEVEYDGDAHKVWVSGIQVTSVYYSVNELNEQNYSQASNNPIEFVNAGTYTVNYYAVGNKNYKDKTGLISFTIHKQTPVMLLDYAYSLQTGQEIHYPSSYVSVQDKNGTAISTGELRYTYYEKYSTSPTEENPNIKTQPITSGSLTLGSAPVYHSEKVYYVVVEYLGDGHNYDVVQSFTELYIDAADNGLFAMSGENEFAFKVMEDGDKVTFEGVEGYSITGTNSKECDAYIEFVKFVNTENGLTELLFESKFGTGAGSIKSGKLIYVTSEYQLVFDDGSASIVIELENEENMLVYFPSSQTKTLAKWEIPSFSTITYTAETIVEPSDANTSSNTTFTFYNDYGTIRFSADINVESHQPTLPPGAAAVGGHETWGGIVVVGMAKNEDKLLCYTLTCYIMTTTSLTTEGYSKEGADIKFRWLVPIQSEQQTPESLEAFGGSKLDDWIYESIDATYTKL